MGYEAGGAVNSGTHGTCHKNTTLGYQAGRAIGDDGVASQNTAIGFQAGVAITTGDWNTLVGDRAGDSITTGGANVCIGTTSDCASSVTNSIAIGNGVSATSSNIAVIGNADVTDVYLGTDKGTIVHSGPLVNDLDAILVTTGTLAYATHSIVRGKYVTVSADAQTLTLPAVVVGAVFIIVNIAADGGALLTIEPDGADTDTVKEEPWERKPDVKKEKEGWHEFKI